MFVINLSIFEVWDTFVTDKNLCLVIITIVKLQIKKMLAATHSRMQLQPSNPWKSDKQDRMRIVKMEQSYIRFKSNPSCR